MLDGLNKTYSDSDESDPEDELPPDPGPSWGRPTDPNKLRISVGASVDEFASLGIKVNKAGAS